MDKDVQICLVMTGFMLVLLKFFEAAWSISLYGIFNWIVIYTLAMAMVIRNGNNKDK
jgi:hypothetical protein